MTPQLNAYQMLMLQLKYLSPPAVKVCLVPDKEDRGRPFPWSKMLRPHEIDKMVSWLWQRNKQGYNVYGSFVSPPRFYLLLDDIPKAKAIELLDKGACWAMETSPDNCQALFPWEGSKELGDVLVKALNKKYGGDPQVAGANRTMRLTGFFNMKKKYGEPYPVRYLGHRPFTQDWVKDFEPLLKLNDKKYKEQLMQTVKELKAAPFSDRNKTLAIFRALGGSDSDYHKSCERDAALKALQSGVCQEDVLTFLRFREELCRHAPGTAIRTLTDLLLEVEGTTFIR